MKVTKHTVEISDGSGIIERGKPKKELKVEEFNVIGENETNIVIDDLQFTTIKIGKSDYFTCLDKPSIGFSTNDKVWGNSVRYTCYSYSKMKPEKIKRFIEKEIQKRYGFFFNSVDLSFLERKS